MVLIPTLEQSIEEFHWGSDRVYSIWKGFPVLHNLRQLELIMVLTRPIGAPRLLYNVHIYAPRPIIFGASSQDSQKPEPPPRRITSNIKQNLLYVKLLRELRRKSTSSVKRPTTGYRKKKTEKLPDDISDSDNHETKLYYTNEGFEVASPVLLVDGYNMCGYWPKLKKHFSKGHLSTARDKLVDELITFSALKGVKVVVVFDAMLSGLATHKETMQNVDVVYTTNSCADSWIEKEVSLLRADGCPKVWVVSSDTFHQHAAYGAGAYIWSCKVLIAEIKDAKKLLQELLHDENMYSVKGKLLEHNLDPEVISALESLKQQLKDDPA